VHLIGSAVPQALQNFAVSGFTASQLKHRMGTRISWFYMPLDHEWRPLSHCSNSGLIVPPRRRSLPQWSLINPHSRGRMRVFC
jgi:hypothetical protein